MSAQSKCFKGSQYRCLLATSFETKEVYDLLMNLCKPLTLTITEGDDYFPKGFEDPRELILTSKRAEPFFEKHFPNIGFKKIKEELKDKWWLTPKKGGNTPNWDLVSSCILEDGRKALLLVEAKAHIGELDKSGKSPAKKNNDNSKANHESIKTAIEYAKNGLNRAYEAKGFGIDIDHCYQLTNRFAYAWKLASLGVPVVLMYLGFVNAYEMGEGYFKDKDHWEGALYDHCKGIIPQNVWNSKPIMIGDIPIYAIHRIMDILVRPDIVMI